MRAVWRQDGVPSCNIGAECGRAEEKRAGYQSAEVYPGLMQGKCVCNPERYKKQTAVELKPTILREKTPD